MKIKLSQILTVVYFVLILLFLKTFNIYSIIFFIIAVLIDYFTPIRNGIKNLLYFLAALSVFPIIFFIFLIYLPFIVFGTLFEKKNFIRNYILGFAISFIPSTIIYLITTYLSIPLRFPVIVLIFYLLPVLAIFILNKKSFETLDIDAKEFFFIIIVLFFTIFIAINIVDDKNLFMANGAREFYRVQVAADGLLSSGLIPLYDPGIGNGESTFLIIVPAFITHYALASLFLKNFHPVLFHNAQSFFILLLYILSLGVLFLSIIKKRSSLNMIAVTAVSLMIGLNFVILQSLESIKAFYTFPIINLFLSIVLNNPKRYNDFLIMMYFVALLPLIHSSVGLAATVLAATLFILIKKYYFRNQDEIKYFIKWFLSNKLKLIVPLIIIFLLPLFYVSFPTIFKDFLIPLHYDELSTFELVKYKVNDFFKTFVHEELSFFSIRYPDINRMDDHQFGFFLSVAGIFTFFMLLILFKIKSIKVYRVFAFGYSLHLVILSFLFIYFVRTGGFYRTPYLYLITLLGASILAFIIIFNNKYVKSILIAVVFIAFLHSVPFAKQNITNFHREQFMGGEIYKEELSFIKQLPIDGRIMTYGLFNNVVDYGISYFTGRYGSRSERISLTIYKTPWERIHGQNSFGDANIITNKDGITLSNYLKAGGYKYIFMNIGHPVANYVVSQIYPDFSYPIYQNGPFVFLVVNDTNYAEKIDLVRNISEDIYYTKDGYKYNTISRDYDFKYDDIDFKDIPNEPEPLKFERLAPEKVRIIGDFKKGEWVLFKELYFPRWRAYMNGQEIPVYTNNHEMILIRTLDGNEILLDYFLTPTEKIIGIASLIGFFSFFIFLLFVLRQSK